MCVGIVMQKKFKKSALITAMFFGTCSPAFAEESPRTDDESPEDVEQLGDVKVTGKSVSYANNEVTEEMKMQQSGITSPLAVIDNLPGVMVTEGDTFGTDDWSTTVSIRGFQLSLDAQQIGTTIDGIANGNSNYGGGAKVNRYIDTDNLANVEVSQGTADIASRSNEALGGSLNFTTINPGAEEKFVTGLTLGDFDAKKYYMRYETGELTENTKAWISLSSSSNTDWIEGSAQNTKDHFAAKLQSDLGGAMLTAYVSYDDAHEDNYQRVGLQQFETDPTWDRLTGEWAGIPYIDQLYRQAWSTLRENTFGYVNFDFDVTSTFQVSANVYGHDNEGRGDWVPPYLVDIVDDQGGPESETLGGASINGGAPLGRLYFVDANGVALQPNAGCESSITFPYGGAGPESDSACYGSGAIPVGSYRHTHYGKKRFGFNADFNYLAQFGSVENELRGGVWVEDYERDEYRDWHKIIDSRVGANFDHNAYWVQYDRTFNVDTTMFYLEDEMDFGRIQARLGVKKFLVDLDAVDNFGVDPTREVNSDSDLLISGGVVAQVNDSLEVFAGYAENFAAVKDTVLERDASTLDRISPETAENIDLGLRYNSGRFQASLTYYDIDFSDRLTFIPPDSPDGIDFLIGTNGSYINVGGIESKGFELSANAYLNDQWSVYGAYTNNDSTYSNSPLEAFPTGNTVFGSAEELFVLSVDWTNHKYFAGLSNKWVGERWLDAANTQRIDGFSVADLYAGVGVDSPIAGIEKIQVRLTINNLFDESYLGGVAGSGAWIGAPRTAAFNLLATF